MFVIVKVITEKIIFLRSQLINHIGKLVCKHNEDHKQHTPKLVTKLVAPQNDVNSYVKTVMKCPPKEAFCARERKKLARDPQT